jgi:hypothetical protein
MRVKLTVINTGGEFSMGIVTDEAKRNLLLNAAENEELSISNWSEDGDVMVEFFEHQEIVGVYGPDSKDGKFLIEEVNEEDEPLNEIYSTYYSDKDYEEIIFQTFTLKNPYIDVEDIQSKCEDEFLIFGGYSVEKNIQNSYIIEVDDFNPKFVSFGTINLDETFGDWEIISEAFYIDDTMLQKMLDLYNDNSNIEEGRELIGEMYGSFYYESESEEGQKLFKSCSLECVFQEGGESKEIQAVLLDMDGEEIFATWN